MILPTKRLSQDRSMLAIGAELIKLLNEPKTISRLWDELKQLRTERFGSNTLTYDWFILTLDLLYMLNVVELDRGRIRIIER